MTIFGNKTEDEKKEDGKESAAPAVLVPTVLLSPRISEKSGRLAKQNKYVFNVRAAANKVEVKKAVESAYKVRVVRVNMVKMEGKSRIYGRSRGKLSDFKKAIVTLPSNQSIVIHEGV